MFVVVQTDCYGMEFRGTPQEVWGPFSTRGEAEEFAGKSDKSANKPYAAEYEVFDITPASKMIFSV